MRFHTRCLLFTTARGLKGVAYRGNMLFFIFYSPSPAVLARVEAGGRIRAECSIYILGEVQHISSIHYSLWAALPRSFVTRFLHRGCSRRAHTSTRCLLHFSPFPFLFAEAYARNYVRTYIYSLYSSDRVDRLLNCDRRFSSDSSRPRVGIHRNSSNDFTTV